MGQYFSLIVIRITVEIVLSNSETEFVIDSLGSSDVLELHVRSSSEPIGLSLSSTSTRLDSIEGGYALGPSFTNPKNALMRHLGHA